jgi:hypothetical protein
MDKYFLIIIGLIFFTILAIYYTKFFGKEDNLAEKPDPIKDGDDFTILE